MSMELAHRQLVALTPGDIVPGASRLLELATEGARTAHCDIYRHGARQPSEIVDGHSQHFEDCPHPDCALVRAFPVRETAPAEQSLLVDRDAELLQELRNHLDEIVITSDNIGDVRHRLFVPWHSQWNGWVRYETAARENKSPVIAAPSGPQETP